MKPLVLIVEDEPALVTMLQYNLEKEGYRVVVAEDGEAALAMAGRMRPDLVLLDWMLPKLSGVEVCREIRRRAETRDTPVIMVTARAEEADKIRGLNTGADDYLTKPFSVPELMARVRALLRRAPPLPQRGELAFADLTLDLGTQRVSRGGKPLHLGPTEFRLMHFFLQHPRTVFSREQLLAAVWGADIHVEPRTVDVHIRRLRVALGEPDPIRTVRAAGYALDDAD
ncbi:MAG: phosphate regulon transcriptional regulator PhoB [Actinomycetota bacterium]